MTEYTERVIKRAKQLAAEEWAGKIRDIHIHRINSMYYEPEPHKVKHKSVTDITYNDGRITRNGQEIVPSQMTGQRLVDSWERFGNEL
tara:strand:+ start:665 stop:928 length:264 start_codon:yes stop_codon:yes gene_type:complete